MARVKSGSAGPPQAELPLGDPRPAAPAPAANAPLILTIGHSTRPAETFIDLLRANGVERLVDVRTRPGSKRNPQFNQETLAAALKAARIAYVHMGELGGLRQPRLDSPNQGLRSPWFRGYADYMQTPAFFDALARLVALAGERRTAIMCAEARPENCHRSLIGDALIARGVRVEHIVENGPRRPHVATAAARIKGQAVSYPGASA